MQVIRKIWIFEMTKGPSETTVFVYIGYWLACDNHLQEVGKKQKTLCSFKKTFCFTPLNCGGSSFYFLLNTSDSCSYFAGKVTYGKIITYISLLNRVFVDLKVWDFLSTM